MVRKRKVAQAVTRGKSSGNSPEDRLNDQQIEFCHQYVTLGSGTVAYRKAYPESGPRTWESGSSRLLSRPEINAMIDSIREEDRAKLKFTREEALKILIDFARSYGKHSVEATESLWEKLGYDKSADSGNGESYSRGVSESVQRIIASRKTG